MVRGKLDKKFQLNEVPRNISDLDRSVAVEDRSPPKANSDDLGQVGAPIPGGISQIAVTVGRLVKRGDPLSTLEAMKM